MPMGDDFHASCAICRWAYVGNQAQDKFAAHLKEHGFGADRDTTLSHNDRQMLKRMGIRWEENDGET